MKKFVVAATIGLILFLANCESPTTKPAESLWDKLSLPIWWTDYILPCGNALVLLSEDETSYWVSWNLGDSWEECPYFFKYNPTIEDYATSPDFPNLLIFALHTWDPKYNYVIVLQNDNGQIKESSYWRRSYNYPYAGDICLYPPKRVEIFKKNIFVLFHNFNSGENEIYVKPLEDSSYCNWQKISEANWQAADNLKDFFVCKNELYFYAQHYSQQELYKIGSAPGFKIQKIRDLQPEGDTKDYINFLATSADRNRIVTTTRYWDHPFNDPFRDNIYISDDVGATWQKITPNSEKFIQAFFWENFIFAIGENNLLLWKDNEWKKALALKDFFPDFLKDVNQHFPYDTPKILSCEGYIFLYNADGIWRTSREQFLKILNEL